MRVLMMIIFYFEHNIMWTDEENYNTTHIADAKKKLLNVIRRKLLEHLHIVYHLVNDQ
jgi:hypothetical protein